MTALAYRVDGPRDAPALVLGSSLGTSGSMWDPQIPAFKDRYRLLVLDMRGHGASSAPPPPYSLDMLADDVLGLLKHIGIARTHFVGLSVGGMIGQMIALRQPAVLDRLALCDTGHAQNADTLKAWEERIAVAQSNGMGPLGQVRD